MCVWCLKTLLILFTSVGFYTGGQSKGSKFLIFHNVLIQCNNKGGTFGVDAVDTDLSAHQFHKLMDDAKSQSGAFNMEVFLFVHPFECVKNIRNVFLLYTLSGIFYRIPHTHFVQLQALASDGECDTSFACIFDCIVQKVDQDLLDTHFVAAEHAWNGRIHVQTEFQSLFLCLDPDHIDNF